MMLVTSNVAKTTARKPTASDTANLPSCASRIRSKKGSENLSALNGVGKVSLNDANTCSDSSTTYRTPRERVSAGVEAALNLEAVAESSQIPVSWLFVAAMSRNALFASLGDRRLGTWVSTASCTE